MTSPGTKGDFLVPGEASTRDKSESRIYLSAQRRSSVSFSSPSIQSFFRSIPFLPSSHPHCLSSSSHRRRQRGRRAAKRARPGEPPPGTGAGGSSDDTPPPMTGVGGGLVRRDCPARARRGGRGGARPELGGEGWVELGPSGGSGWSRAPSELGVECRRSSGRSAGGSRTDDLRGGGAADRDRAAGGAARPSERRLRMARRGPL